jgi:hypothetical protein
MKNYTSKYYLITASPSSVLYHQVKRSPFSVSYEDQIYFEFEFVLTIKTNCFPSQQIDVFVSQIPIKKRLRIMTACQIRIRAMGISY